LQSVFLFCGGAFRQPEASPGRPTSRYPGLDALSFEGGLPMSRCPQRFSAVLIAVALLLVQVAPVAAATGQDLESKGRTNLVADAMILRPLGLAMVGVGTVVWAVGVAPFVAITRPTDLGESMEYLIMRPVRYTFVDPLGHH
jgi:hypothetical protein